MIIIELIILWFCAAKLLRFFMIERQNGLQKVYEA